MIDEQAITKRRILLPTKVKTITIFHLVEIGSIFPEIGKNFITSPITVHCTLIRFRSQTRIFSYEDESQGVHWADDDGDYYVCFAEEGVSTGKEVEFFQYRICPWLDVRGRPKVINRSHECGAK